MRATILVSDNVVTIDGRPLGVDCSSIDPNIRVVQWYENFGEVEFVNDPEVGFRRNGRIDTWGEFDDVIDAWHALAQKIDTEEALRVMPVHEATRVMEKIDSEPVLKAMPQADAVQMVKKIESDPELRAEPTAEAIRLLTTIEQEPMLAGRYPGPAVQELKAVEREQAPAPMMLRAAAVPAPPTPLGEKLIAMRTGRQAVGLSMVEPPAPSKEQERLEKERAELIRKYPPTPPPKLE